MVFDFEKASKMIDQYNKVEIEKVNYLICPNCDIEMGFGHDSFLTCFKCGATDFNIFEQQKEYIENPKIKHKYKNISHVKEIINCLQAKEYRSIGDTVLNQIVEPFTYENIRAQLKKLKLTKYNENIEQIYSALNKTEPPFLTYAEEDKVLTTFKKIFMKYDKYRIHGRKNFISYAFIFNKIFTIMNRHDLAVKFKAIKQKSKLLQHEEIYRRMVADKIFD
jgi:flagellin-specific chaperone FliS